MNYWYIWCEIFEDDISIGKSKYPYAYTYKSSAVRRSKQMWGEDFYNPITNTTIKRKWIVSQTNPWES